MNVLLRLRKDMPITGIIPFKYLLYSAMLSNVVPFDDEDVRYGVFSESSQELYDYFSDWGHSDIRRNEVYKALSDLCDEGLIFFDDDNRVYLGEYRGRRFFPFEVKSSLFDNAIKLLDSELKRYGMSKSAKDKSRMRYIREQVDRFLDKGVENMTAGDFTELHGYMYEVYTGGEIYVIRNKTEYFQTNNMLKAYDKYTVFALIVEATLHYELYRKRAVPTLTNVACMKDDVFHALTKSDDSSKEYMRDITSSISKDSEF